MKNKENSCKKNINGRMDHTTVETIKTITISRNLKSKKQHQTHLKVKRENSQALKTYKMEKNKWKIKLLKDTKQERMPTHQKSRYTKN